MLSRKQAKILDEKTIHEMGIPGIVLMENAGRNIFEYLLTLKISGKIVICCGKGNNAGDGLVIARYLHNHNFDLQVLLFSNPCDFSGDAKMNYEIATKIQLPMRNIETKNWDMAKQELITADWLIDGIFGTGLQGKVRSPYDQIIQAMNESTAKIVAIDIPSGLDCDTGEPLGIAVKAQYTATIVDYKTGFANPKAQEYVGHVHVIDIGIPKKSF